MALAKTKSDEIDLQGQVISKERVLRHGEVFTAEKEVKAMLDLVKEESFRIEAIFLEPSCGTGNFLVEILRRKLQTVKKKQKNQEEWEKDALHSLSSIYGIELMDDTAKISRKRLFEIFEEEYRKLFVDSVQDKILQAANFILQKNIIIGDTLKMKTTNGKPIVFTEWLFSKDKVVRKEFEMRTMIDFYKDKECSQGDLFSQELLPQKIYKPVKIKSLGDANGKNA